MSALPQPRKTTSISFQARLS